MAFIKKLFATQLKSSSLFRNSKAINSLLVNNKTIIRQLSGNEIKVNENLSGDQLFSGLSIETNADILHGLHEQQIELRSNVRKFVEKELPQDLVQQMDKDSHWSGFRQFWTKLGNMGLMGVTAESRFGGLQLGYFEHCIIMEEISRCCPAIGLSYGAHSNLCVNQLTLNGSEEQKCKYLPKLIDGSFVGALAMSEVSSGSDVTSMRTTAQKHKDYYVLNGSKFWITNGSEADVVFVYAKTSDKGITPFIVEKGMEGFSIGQKIDKLGMRGSPTAELIFDNCKVPVSNMVGNLDNGVYILMSGLDYERLVLSAGPLGIMQSACEQAFQYAHQRFQFDQPIGQFQLLQGKMADMYTRLSSSRSYLYNIARAIDRFKTIMGSNASLKGTSPLTKDCTGVILLLSETATQISLDAIQILGGNGYSNEYSVGRLLRDAKLYEIGAGTSEIRRWLIGREINKEYLR
jgi:isovaleryl-CoA dehydrogenase